MGDAAGLMRLEAPDDVPGLANDADPSIVRAEEEAVGACADAGDLVAFEELLGFLGREGDLGDVEEVKRLPLSGRISEMPKMQAPDSIGASGRMSEAHVPRGPS